MKIILFFLIFLTASCGSYHHGYSYIPTYKKEGWFLDSGNDQWKQCGLAKLLISGPRTLNSKTSALLGIPTVNTSFRDKTPYLDVSFQYNHYVPECSVSMVALKSDESLFRPIGVDKRLTEREGHKYLFCTFSFSDAILRHDQLSAKFEVSRLGCDVPETTLVKTKTREFYTVPLQ